MKKHYYITDANNRVLRLYGDLLSHAEPEDSNLKYLFLSQAMETINRLQFLQNDEQLLSHEVEFPLHVELIATKYKGLIGISHECLNAIEYIYDSIKDRFSTDYDELYQAWIWYIARYAGEEFIYSRAIKDFIEHDALALYRDYEFERGEK